MEIYKQCWVDLNCEQVSCPVYGTQDPDCWAAATDCYYETKGSPVFKFLNCIRCRIFENNASEKTKKLAVAIMDFQTWRPDIRDK